MAKTDEKVMAMVEAELKKNPDATVQELFDKAKAINASIGKLTNRQFHARYPLQVKRRMKTKPASRKKSGKKARKGGRSKKAAPSAAADVNREAVRETLLRFASDLAAAEARKDLVRVLAGVDKYVDQVVKAAKR